MEKWLIDRAKSAKSQHLAESWMIVAKCLAKTKSGFDVEMTSYNLDLEGRKEQEASESLVKLYDKYKKEPRFWAEIERIVSVLNSDGNNNLDDNFRKAIFKHLSIEMQEKMLLELAIKNAHSDYGCTVFLLMLKLFPKRVDTFGNELVETFLKLSESNSTMNKYALALVCQVCPVVITCSALNISFKKCEHLLLLTLRFCVTLSINDDSIQLECGKIRKMLTQSVVCSQSLVSSSKFTAFRVDIWTNTRRFFAWMADKFFWKAKMPNDLSIDSVQKTIDTMSKVEKLGEQYLNLFLFAWLFTKWYSNVEKSAETHQKSTETDKMSIQAGDLPRTVEQKLPVLALVAPDFTASCDLASDLLTDQRRIVPMKKRRYSEQMAKFVGEIVEKETLESAAFCLQKPTFDSLRSRIFPRDTFPLLYRFEIDVDLISGHFEDALLKLETLRNNGSSDWSVFVQSASCEFGRKNYTQACRFALCSLEKPPTSMHTVVELPFQSSSTVHSTYIFSDNCLLFVCRLVVNCLCRRLAPTSKSEPTDAILGHLLVLSQVSWHEGGSVLFRMVVQLIASKITFSYPNLLSYVINIDVLEELSFLSLDKYGVKLQLFEGDLERRIGLNTRHRVKGAKDGIRQALEIQLSRCHYPIEPLIYSFLIAQKEAIISIVDG